MNPALRPLPVASPPAADNFADLRLGHNHADPPSPVDQPALGNDPPNAVSYLKPKILIVDDEPSQIKLLSYALQARSYRVISAKNGLEALARLRSEKPDLVILDVMMPELDGFEVCRILRRQAATENLPVLLLSALSSELDRIIGLECGADDYVTKPYSTNELLLRIRKLLERRAIPRDDCLRSGPVTVDLARHQVIINHDLVQLTFTEFKLLATLIERRGHVLTRDQLLEGVWNYPGNPHTRTLDAFIHRLREKLGAAGRYVATVRSIGYRWTLDE